MKKNKKNKKEKYDLAHVSFINLAPLSETIRIEIVASETDHSVNIRMIGFDEFEDVAGYAEFLADNLPLLLYQTTIIH